MWEKSVSLEEFIICQYLCFDRLNRNIFAADVKMVIGINEMESANELFLFSINSNRAWSVVGFSNASMADDS